MLEGSNYNHLTLASCVKYSRAKIPIHWDEVCSMIPKLNKSELSWHPQSESYLFVCPALDFREYRVEGGSSGRLS